MEAALFADAEALICSYLRGALVPYVGAIHVSTDVPNPRPDDEGFIRVIRTGGPQMNIVADGPQLTLEAWCYSAERAAEIMAYARALLHALEGSYFNNVAFYRLTEFTGPQNTADPDSSVCRYTWTFRIGVRGIPLA